MSTKKNKERDPNVTSQKSNERENYLRRRVAARGENARGRNARGEKAHLSGRTLCVVRILFQHDIDRQGDLQNGKSMTFKIFDDLY